MQHFSNFLQNKVNSFRKCYTKMEGLLKTYNKHTHFKHNVGSCCKTKVNIERFELLKQMHQARDLTRPGQGPANVLEHSVAQLGLAAGVAGQLGSLSMLARSSPLSSTHRCTSSSYRLCDPLPTARQIDSAARKEAGWCAVWVWRVGVRCGCMWVVG